MKKYLLLTLSLLTLASCGRNIITSNDSTSEDNILAPINIICPTGAPAVAFYNHAEDSHFETNSTPSNIVAMLNSSSDKDMVVIDTVSGIKAIQKGAPYKLAAIITFGNFYIASTGHDTNNQMDPTDKIVLFGQNQTPDLVFHYLYGDTYNDAIEYVTNVQDAAKCLASGKNIVTTSDVDYVFVAEPVLSATLSNQNAATYGKASLYKNIQEEYKIKSKGLNMIQASVFVKNSIDKSIMDAHLRLLNDDIENVIETPSLIDETIGKLDADRASAIYGIAPAMAKKTIQDNNKLGLGFAYAKNNKQAISSFASLFGVESINDEIYY